VPDESEADDGAIYAEWATFTAAEVDTYFDRLERLHRAFVRLHGADPPPELVAEAHDLTSNGMHLGHLPALREVLANGLAP
jgi:hypothetical protein